LLASVRALLRAQSKASDLAEALTIDLATSA